MTWKPLHGIRRQLWTKWSWGNISWDGCDYPRSLTKSTCAPCDSKHPGLVQFRLIRCRAWSEHFHCEYCAARGKGAQHVQRWGETATEDHLNCAARLRIPSSLAVANPMQEREHWR